MNEILRVEHIVKHFVKKTIFGSKTSVVRASDDVSFSLGRGEVFVLAGESGSGKSTIAKIILGSIHPDSGEILLHGNKINRNQRDMKKIRTVCQMIHQDPYDSINPRMRVSDIISEPLDIHGIFDTSSARDERIREVLEEVKLEPVDEIIYKYPHMLSGGQRQRVVLARALAIKPQIIIADEPVSMLDVSIRAEMLDLMRDLQKKHQISFLYITHDLATARHFGQRVGILYMGKIVETGKINDVLFSPLHPYTRALTDAISDPDPDNLHKKKKIRIVHQQGQFSKDVIKESSIVPTELNYSMRGGCRFAPRCPCVIDACVQEPDLQEKIPERFSACHVNLMNNDT